MTITHIASAANNGTDSSATATINSTGANLLIVTVSRFDSAVAQSLTDSLGNTWTALTERLISSSVRVRGYYCLNPSVGASHTFTVAGVNAGAGTSIFPAIAVSAFAGVGGYGSETGGTQTSAATGQPGSITPIEDGALLVTGESFNVAGTQSVNSGYTIGAQQNFASGTSLGVAQAYLIQTTAAAVNPTWSESTSPRAMFHTVFYITGPLLAGTASLVTEGDQSVQVSATDVTGGTSPYSYQWERSTTSGSGFSNVSGATSLSLTDSGLTNYTTYYYRLKYTDAAASTSTSNEISATPTNATEYTVVAAALYLSPYNWRLNGSSYAETNNPGAYLKFKFTGNSAVLRVSTTINSSLSAGNYPAITYSINGGAFTRTQLTSGQSTVTLVSGLGTVSGPHTCIIYLDAAWWESDRWTTPASALRVTGIRLTTGVMSAPDIYTDKAIIFGDSNCEGYEASAAGVSVANQKAVYALGVLIGRALECEIGVIGFAGQGWITAGGGNVPAMQDAWDLYSAGQSRLSGGLLSPAPKYIISEHGQNDGSSVESAATTVIGEWQAAAPNARIIICSPSNLDEVASLQAACEATGATFVTTWENLLLAPWASSGSHLNAAGQGRYAAIVAGEILRSSASETSDVWYRLKSVAAENGMELIEQ